MPAVPDGTPLCLAYELTHETLRYPSTALVMVALGFGFVVFFRLYTHKRWVADARIGPFPLARTPTEREQRLVTVGVLVIAVLLAATTLPRDHADYAGIRDALLQGKVETVSWTVDTIENAPDRGFWVGWAEFRFFPRDVGRSIGFQPSLTSGIPLADGMPVRVQFVEHRGRKAIVRLEVPPGVLGCNAAGVE